MANTVSYTSRNTMSHTIEHTVEIDAEPAAVWCHLTDTAAYPSWNPFVRQLEGALVEGGRLAPRLAPPGRRGVTFAPAPPLSAPPRGLAGGRRGRARGGRPPRRAHRTAGRPGDDVRADRPRVCASA